MLTRKARAAGLVEDAEGVEAALRGALAVGTGFNSPEVLSFQFALAASLDRKGTFAEASAFEAVPLLTWPAASAPTVRR